MVFMKSYGELICYTKCQFINFPPIITLVWKKIYKFPETRRYYYQGGHL